jgi:hypothetical protein
MLLLLLALLLLLLALLLLLLALLPCMPRMRQALLLQRLLVHHGHPEVLAILILAIGLLQRG